MAGAVTLFGNQTYTIIIAIPGGQKREHGTSIGTFPDNTPGGETLNGHDNLIPGNKRSKEEVREIGKKGGRASVAARRRKKALKEVLNETLGIRIGDIQDEKVRSVLLTAANSKDGNLTIREAIINGVVLQAVKGNPKAVALILDITEESPAVQIRKRELEIKEKRYNQGQNTGTVQLNIQWQSEDGK